MPKAARRERRGLPKQGALFRRTERVRRVAAIAREVDQATEQLPRVHVASENGMQEVRGFVMESHLPESEAQARNGDTGWVSGPALPAYQSPAHVGIRARLGVREDDSELLDYGKYIPAGR